ncbi:MAG: cbb3-type cytochrome c oxidase subunit I [Actinomycetota bacterium]|nr:cbb3-type cytochrome c oxidase subunit I [Actinomycetota bacterium]
MAGSTDHKHIGLLAAATAFVFFLLGGALALLMRAELAQPGLRVLSDDAYNQVFTMHGSTMFYLFGVPMALALGLYLVPLQVGAAEIAWPRLALLGFWLFLGGGVIMYAGFLTDQGANKSGWTAFDPLSNSTFSPGTGTDFWIVGVFLGALAAMLWAACVLATIMRRRAPGMTMLRIPIFSWSMVVTCLLVLTAFPAVLAAMTLLYVDRHYGGVLTGASGAITYQHLFWFYGHPVVYIVFFPFFGAAVEAIAASARRRFFGYRGMVFSLLAFAALSMSVWGHHMFTTGQVTNRYFALTSTALIVPAGLEYLSAIATMWGGRIRLRTSMLFALGLLLLFLLGGLSGIFTGSPPLDYHVHDTYFVVAHFHYTLFGGTVMGLFAGVYHWFPKVTGRRLGEGLGKVHFALTVVGGLLTFVPMFFLGHEGMVRRISDYPAEAGWEGLNVVSTVGAFVIFLGMLVFVVNVARSLRLGPEAGDDPWDGHTLEWATTSPPPRHNFDTLPPVRSYAPLLDLREQGVGPRSADLVPAGEGGHAGGS